MLLPTRAPGAAKAPGLVAVTSGIGQGAEVGPVSQEPTFHALQQFSLAPYSITSSARRSRLCGTVRPRVLAVWRLMTISTFVANCAGRLPGFSPFRIRPI